MVKKLTIFGIIVLILSAGIYLRDEISLFIRDVYPKLPNVQELSFDKLKEVEKKILTPPPLRGPIKTNQSVLSAEGIIEWTNKEREKQNLPPLTVNKKLADAAVFKAQQMFEYQYFAHLSPKGDGPSELANQVAYDYLVIGENLAMGNFLDDTDLVNSWMNSEGHRENILNSRFTEIGVSAIRGVYEGEETWMSVQEFGTPISICPQPDEKLKVEIDSLETAAKESQAELEKKYSVINNSRNTHPDYNKSVKEYNNLVDNYNSIIADLKIIVGQYNKQVNQFNECIK